MCENDEPKQHVIPSGQYPVSWKVDNPIEYVCEFVSCID